MSSDALVEVIVDPHDVDIVLDRVRQIFSPVTLQEFLRVGPSRILRDRATQRFESEGDDASGRWAPLRFATEEIRVAKGFAPGPINQRTREMLSFVTSNPGQTTTDGEGAMLTWPSPEPAGELFTKLNTAQHGKAYPSTVKRPVVAADETDMQLIMDELMTWFATEMARTGHA